MEKVLVTGAAGQLGTELTQKLTELYGPEAVIASDIQPEAEAKFPHCRFVLLDVMDREALRSCIKKESVTQVYHLAAVLSARAETNPQAAWHLNMDSLLHVLELARECKLDKVFWPSSIAVFGPDSPKVQTPQLAPKEPVTAYGIAKLAGEHWCAYYHQQYGVDVRSLRFPGLIGYKALPGGGTTDYAVAIFHQALAGKPFCSFLEKDTRLPMMYMPDAIKATCMLMQAPKERIGVRSSYNLAAMSFTPEELYRGIVPYFPEFRITYEPDYRQAIAAGWPRSIDDREARQDWNWSPDYEMPAMIRNILQELPKLQAATNPTKP
ncbi:Nucleoside-diphosphate-sugar epimerase [Cyclobacterium xiamenense]|uniref:Nucleoside-diphosphate-sugar epimerase n=1 Tax=Cyclobacterium xiamenense TaxID=1297121 RepID=A0A1H7APF8_9BACT|nr:NAD-dependent epimerase/dehydratase family protein [Cyclobacterium xiamenense]SEJ67449.1 Nucleoside-diphosphate-sugar epimerase [Cyclobacterium xiamenense]